MSEIKTEIKPFNLKECIGAHGGHCITADGSPARVVFTDARRTDGYNIVALTVEDGQECISLHNAQGDCVNSQPRLKLHLPMKRYRLSDGWRNVYRRASDGAVYLGSTRYTSAQHAADVAAASTPEGVFLRTVEVFVEVEV